MWRRIMQRSVDLIPGSVRSRIKNIPVVAPLQRFVLRRTLHGKPFVHTITAGPAKGLVFPVELPRDKGIWTGTYELAFAQALANAVRPGDVCFDIGAHRGFMAGVLCQAGAKQVVAFEPFPENVTQIRRVIDLNPGLNMKVLELAVGDRDGEAEFAVMQENSMGKLATSQFQHDAAIVDTLKVAVRRLDGLVETGTVPHPNIMKIDVEGAEAEVLQGCPKLLAECRPMLFLEVHSHALAEVCSNLLQSQNYKLTWLTGPPSQDPTSTLAGHLIAVPN